MEVLTAFILLISVMVVWLGPEAFLEKFHLLSVQKIIKMEEPIDVRLLFYKDTLPMVRDFTLTGSGFNTYGTRFTHHRSFDFNDGYLETLGS